MHKIDRYHDFSCGHRVHGHESKCAHLHGHNYRVTFTCVMTDGNLDHLGRVIDFSVIKERLCIWLEDNWDHKFLIWTEDPMFQQINKSAKLEPELAALWLESLVRVPFNPTAENMAEHLVEVVGRAVLQGTGVRLQECRVEETRKCAATYSYEVPNGE